MTRASRCGSTRRSSTRRWPPGDAWLGPIPPAVRAAFYAETVPIARLFGIAESLIPADVDAFDAYVASMLAPSGPVHPTATSRDLAAVDPPSAARPWR